MSVSRQSKFICTFLENELSQVPPYLSSPQSEGLTSNDRTLESLDYFRGQQVICTEKRDSECSSLYPNGYGHARSISSTNHEWQSWLKRFWQERYFDLPQGWRVCGENLYAAHSIKYTLESYFAQQCREVLKDFLQLCVNGSRLKTNGTYNSLLKFSLLSCNPAVPVQENGFPISVIEDAKLVLAWNG